MGRRVNKPRAGGIWSESRYFAFIRGALRKAASRYPVKLSIKKKARRKKPEGVEGRHVYEFQCKHCTGWFPDKDVEVDHIIPAGTLKTYNDLPRFVELLFCEEDNLQLLCKTCHRAKTKREREERK